ncbi:MAG: hypothetical protein J6B63_04665 [Treponema sp.]|nr:hypothetical protein [Treponema sp.]MBP3630248.1 hypothetical protein [Clostridia bacterium]
MTRDEVIVIMGTLQVAYPRFYKDLSPQQANLTVNLWTKMLEDVTAEQATLAINKIIATSEWPPTIADVRKAIFETQQGSVKDAGEAWGEVTAAMRMFGYMREKEALESMSEQTRTAVKYINWQTLCRSKDSMADRAHFFKVYETVKQRSIENNQVPLFIKDKILENIEMNKPKIEPVAVISDNQDIQRGAEVENNNKPERISEILQRMKLQIINNKA